MLGMDGDEGSERMIFSDGDEGVYMLDPASEPYLMNYNSDWYHNFMHVHIKYLKSNFARFLKLE